MGQFLHGSAMTTRAVRAELQPSKAPAAALARRYGINAKIGAVCSANDIKHRQTKPYHPWTNGQAERMVRTIKDVTVKSFHYSSIINPRNPWGRGK